MASLQLRGGELRTQGGRVELRVELFFSTRRVELFLARVEIFLARVERGHP